MIKKILILLFLLLITAYLIVAVTAFNTKPADQVCKGMELIIKDSIDHGFISQKGILRLLNGKKLSPVGKKMGDINTRLLEEELSQHPLIENVECYRTPGCKIGIEVTQRLPILRVMANNGDNYYIDNKGKIMPIPNSSAHVAVVTGYVDRDFAEGTIYLRSLSTGPSAMGCPDRADQRDTSQRTGTGSTGWRTYHILRQAREL